MIKITQFWTYPVKSLAGYAVQKAKLYQRGMAHDRRWMLVDNAGRFISQREHPMLARIQAELVGEELLLTHLDDGRSLRIPSARPEDAPLVEVAIWRDRLAVQLLDGSDELRAFFGFSVRLVYMGAQQQRLLNPDYATPGETVSFADGYPYLIINQASVDALAERVGRPLDPLRFRPNLIIEGIPAFTEDALHQLEVPGGRFSMVKPCARCTVISIDPTTGEREPDVLKALSAFRRQGNKVLFGMNARWEGAEGAVLKSPLLIHP